MDDGTIIKYRWYRFRDQPTSQELIADYPEIYTEEYLNNIQLKIEEMHRVWGAKQPFMETPTSLGDINLVHAGSDVRFGLLGGRFVGEATLLRFYVLHCIAVPFIAMIFMAVHFWRIRKDGGISGPM